jgi:acetylornithine deacetylase/succinyl-diaminopimelate desuccinylase-like protein
MADSTPFSNRREFMTAAALAGAGAMVLGARGVSAAAERYPSIRKAAEAGREAAIKRIQDWIALPSIAAENRSMQEGAEYMATLAREAGFDSATIVPTDGHPGVYATMDNGAKRTLALYFMYDVKQFDPKEWTSPPLEGRIVDKPGFGRAIVGRGAVNQKGPEATVLAALHAMRAAKVKPPVNIVLVAEGEEEIGSPHFHQIVQKPEIFAALKKAEGIFIPASWQDSNGNVSVNLGSKGVIELELVASGAKWGRGPKGDIHSSQKASVDSPVWRLVHALDSLVTPDGNTPAIDGWFENVRALTPREKELIAEVARSSDEAEQKKLLGVSRWIDDLPYQQALERLASQPTVNIEGLVAGYTGPGGKTILPGRAVAKLDLRLVPNQTRKEAVEKIRAHLEEDPRASRQARLQRRRSERLGRLRSDRDCREQPHHSRRARDVQARGDQSDDESATGRIVAGRRVHRAAAVTAGGTLRHGPRLRRARARRILCRGVDQSEGCRHHRRGDGLRRYVLSDRAGELSRLS